MHIDIIKITAALIIFTLGLFGGLLPSLAVNRKRAQGLLMYGDFFARGIFLGAGLIHLLPDALTEFAKVEPQMTYPVILALCASTVFFVQFIEQGLLKIFIRRGKEPIVWLPFLLMVLLSIHSLIVGAALGIGDTLSSIFIIFLAVIAHKSAAAFALGINMQKSGVKSAIYRKIIILFALMTPLGILLGSVLNYYLEQSAGELAQAVFNAIAAGTFLYIATFCYEGLHIHDGETAITKMLYFGLGIGLMALVAIWI